MAQNPTLANDPTPPSAIALWNLGFRPFFLAASVFAAISIAAWVAQFAGVASGHEAVKGPLWHAHEMVFGYAFAVIVGFLFTSVRNWTGQSTPTGLPLAAIVCVWVVARVLAATPWTAPAAAFDAAFAAAAAVGIARPLFASRNRRNYFFVALLLGLGAVNVGFYLAIDRVEARDAMRAVRLGLDLVLFTMIVMGGRVIPMFTANAVPDAKPRRIAALELTALGAVLALFGADLLRAPDGVVAATASVAALVHAIRLAFWRPWKVGARPILWILHAAYAWIVVHLALRALAAIGTVPMSIADHALTVGGIGALTLGMMTRVARGHTARPLIAGPAETTAYALVLAAAAVRVLVPLLWPAHYAAAIVAAGALWVAAFGLIVVVFWPIVSRPRIDGRAG
jgi:uncharacterized protein involved in response to NO